MNDNQIQLLTEIYWGFNNGIDHLNSEVGNMFELDDEIHFLSKNERYSIAYHSRCLQVGLNKLYNKKYLVKIKRD